MTGSRKGGLEVCRVLECGLCPREPCPSLTTVTPAVTNDSTLARLSWYHSCRIVWRNEAFRRLSKSRNMHLLVPLCWENDSDCREIVHLELVVSDLLVEEQHLLLEEQLSYLRSFPRRSVSGVSASLSPSRVGPLRTKGDSRNAFLVLP